MELLKDKILKDGKVYKGNILKVDSFLNHQIDVPLLNEIGKEFKRLFADCGINKILTIEASGIGIACIAAQYFDCPVVFAKKSQSKNISGEVFTAPVYSFTHDKTYNIMVSKSYLSKDDRVLIIDDFLAKGNALIGLINLINHSGASLQGAGIVIEKGFQDGGERVRSMGVNLQSLAIVRAMNPLTGQVEFCN